MTTRYTWRSMTSSIPAPVPGHRSTRGICERFHKTVLQAFYPVPFRKKIHATIDALQSDLDEWLRYYNHERTHQGKMCCGRTPMATLEDGKLIWKEKCID